MRLMQQHWRIAYERLREVWASHPPSAAFRTAARLLAWCPDPLAPIEAVQASWPRSLSLALQGEYRQNWPARRMAQNRSHAV